MIQFTIQGQPVAKGRARAFIRAGKIGQFTPEKTARYENLVALQANIAMAGRDPLRGAVVLVVAAIFEIPKSWSAKKREAAMSGALQHTGRPDCDNIGKILADGMNGIAYVDDSQICSMTIQKMYGAPARVMVTIDEVV